MCRECKILILEDVETDAELEMDEVKKTFTDISFKCVDNKEDFKAGIESFNPDLVLADYSLPTYDGMSALKYVLEHSPDTPVIFVTGSVNEGTAVSAMKAGAVDYILKDKMSRLGLAVKTALENNKIKIERQKAKLDLEKSERYYRSILKYMHDEVVVISRDCIITDINNSILHISGKKREDIIGQPCYKVLYNFDSPCFNHGIECYHQQVLDSGKNVRYQRKTVDPEGEVKWQDIIVSPLFDADKKITHIIESYRDITELVEAKNTINMLSTVVEQSPLSISIMDMDGLVTYVNPAFTLLTGFENEDILGKSLRILSADNLSDKDHDQLLKVNLQGDFTHHIFTNKRKDGSQYSVSASIGPFKDSRGTIIGLIELQEDITQRLLDQEQIKKDLKEKELLLQEIYHRVNNNMQIMISLFNMQIERSSMKAEKDVLITAQSRIGAMSAIHNDIYQERSFVAINFGNVTRNIFNTLCDSLMVTSGNIELAIEADIPNFGLDLAQPCALIVNELISNSMRYAYPDGKGMIYVNLTIDEFEELTLIVRDNGIGIPESIDPEKSDTMGFTLVYLLATGQLNGSVDIKRDKGTTVTIKFKRIKDQKRF